MTRPEPRGARVARELQELLHLVSRAEHRITSRLASVLATEGTGVAQWRVLVLLADGAGHSMTEVADYALLPAASVTRVVDGMVVDGLVYRTRDPRDGRRVLVHLSQSGRKRYRRLAKRIEEHRDAIVAPGDAARLERLRELLATLDGPDS